MVTTVFQKFQSGPKKPVIHVQIKLTCGCFVFDLLQFGERGRGQDLQVDTFPCLKELGHTVHRQLDDKQQQTFHIWKHPSLINNLFFKVNLHKSLFPGQQTDIKTDRRYLICGQLVVCAYRVVDDLYRLRVDAEQLVSGAFLWV